MPRRIYLIGSLRNPDVPLLAKRLRGEGHYVFDDWYAAGPRADDEWQAYEKARGRSYPEALSGHHAHEVFALDKKYLDACDTAVLLLPAGRSGHLELGYMLGRGHDGFILYDLEKEPDRWDIMYRFATGVFFKQSKLIKALRRDR